MVIGTSSMIFMPSSMSVVGQASVFCASDFFCASNMMAPFSTMGSLRLNIRMQTTALGTVGTLFSAFRPRLRLVDAPALEVDSLQIDKRFRRVIVLALRRQVVAG